MPVVRAGVGGVAGHIRDQDVPLQLDPSSETVVLGDETSGLASPRDRFAHIEATTANVFSKFHNPANTHSNSNPVSSTGVLSYVTDWQLDVAETYVLDACKGRPPHVRMQHKDHFLCFQYLTPLKVYDLIHHRFWRWFMTCMITIQLALGFFEHNNDFHNVCTIIEVFVLVISTLDAILRLFSHDSQPTSQIHGILQAHNGSLLDANGEPLGGTSPPVTSSSPLYEGGNLTKNYSSTSSSSTASVSTKSLNNYSQNVQNIQNYQNNFKQETPVLRPLPSFEASSNTMYDGISGLGLQAGSRSNLFSPQRSAPSSSNSKRPLSFDQFCQNQGEFSAALSHNPDIVKHIPEIAKSVFTAQQRQLPSIEAPVARWSKTTSPRLNKLSRLFSWSRIRLAFIALTFLDIILTLIFGRYFANFYRVSRLIRPFFFLEKGRVLRQLVKAVARTVPAVLEVVVLITLAITTFSVAGFFLFSAKGLRIGDNPFFDTIENSMFSMTVLMTTANFPDVMMSSYSVSNVSALFFCSFLIVALYLLFNVILSAVYSRFQYVAYRLLHTVPLTQLYALTAAFELLSRPPSTPMAPHDFIPTLDLNSTTYTPNNKTVIPGDINHNGMHNALSSDTNIPISIVENNRIGLGSDNTSTNMEDSLLRGHSPSESYGATANAIPLYSLGKHNGNGHNNKNININNNNNDNNSLHEPLLSNLNQTNNSFISNGSPIELSNDSTEIKTNTRRCIDNHCNFNKPPLTFSQWKKQSWLFLLNQGYTQHARINAYEQYKLYLQMNYPDQCTRILQKDKGPIFCQAQDVISQDTFLRLLSRMRPDITPQQAILLFEALDQQQHHHIHIHEWFSFADFIDVQFISADYRTAKQKLAISPINIPEHFPKILHWIGRFLTHWLFNTFLDMFTVFHFLVLLIQLETASPGSFWNKFMDIVNIIALIFYTIEYGLKIIIFGPKRMYKSLICSFEIILLATSYVLYAFYYFANRDTIFDPNSSVFIVRWLHSFFDQPNLTSLALTSTDILAFRIIRLYRHLYSFPRFRAILTTLKRLYPALRSLGVILISEYYFFGLLGVCLFQGVIKKGQMGPEFMATYWAQNNYWENNFDDLYHAYIVLFEIMIINNWNLNVEGWTVALDSHWPRVFFVCHFFLAIVIILNCVIALVLDAFISKYSSNEDLTRQQRAEARALDSGTVKDHIREHRRSQQLTSTSSSLSSASITTTASSAPTQFDHESQNRQIGDSNDYVMLDDEEQYQPYEIEDSSSDDEQHQLVLTLIKRADHQGTIQEEPEDEYDDEGNFVRHKSFHGRPHGSSLHSSGLHSSGLHSSNGSAGRLMSSRGQNANGEEGEPQQQRIVFKRRTQRRYQMIFGDDSIK
jgi:hypothetical protein